MKLDCADMFRPLFDGKVFPTFAEFADLLEQFEQESGTVFRMRSSKLIRGDNIVRYKNIRYQCDRADFQHVVRSTGVRHTRYKSTNCPAHFSVVSAADGLRVRKWCMKHNHSVNPELMEQHRKFRTLSKDEKQIIKPLFECKCSSQGIKLFALERFGKRLTSKDVTNLRIALRTVSHSDQ
ncbi:unnamed protein product [Calicophoron daubneyi]|uniref:FAR1 domain-containing protein n=1 Tax=Calicophoron daubneyi TaxID=300641 RepID=A0AAV2T6X9_CALDB